MVMTVDGKVINQWKKRFRHEKLWTGGLFFDYYWPFIFAVLAVTISAFCWIHGGFQPKDKNLAPIPDTSIQGTVSF